MEFSNSASRLISRARIILTYLVRPSWSEFFQGITYYSITRLSQYENFIRNHISTFFEAIIIFWAKWVGKINTLVPFSHPIIQLKIILTLSGKRLLSKSQRPQKNYKTSKKNKLQHIFYKAENRSRKLCKILNISED